MSAKYKSPSFLLPNELNTSANTANDTGINSLYSMYFPIGSFANLDNLTQTIRQGNLLTVSYWYYPTNAGGDGYMIGSGQASNGPFESRRSGYNIRMTWKNSSNASFVITTTNSSITLNNWMHICCIWDTTNSVSSDKMQIWINGVRNTTLTGSGTTATGSGFSSSLAATSTWINQFRPGTTSQRSNYIDELAFFNKALTSTEIAALYDGTGSNIRPSNLMATDLNPIAYYPLGEQAQNTGKLPEATANVWQFPNGVLQDYVMDFDGSSDYISLSDDTFINTTSPFTISGWFNLDSIDSGGYSAAFAFKTNSNHSFVAYISNQVGYVGVAFGEAGSGNAINTSTNVSSLFINKWANLTITYNGSGISSSSNYNLYINGQAQTLTSNTGFTGYGNVNLLGYYHDTGFFNGFNGSISNLAIWNTDQSANVANIYNNGSPQTSYTVTPQNWWKLNATSVYTPSAPNYTTAVDFNYLNTDSLSLGTMSTLSAESEVTFSIWAKITKPGGSQGFNMLYTDNSDGGSGNKGVIYIEPSGFNARYKCTLRATSSLMTSYFPIATFNSWHNVTVTFGTTYAKLYLNGQLQDTEAVGTAANLGVNAFIGRYSSSSSVYATGGLLSNFAIFNSELTASQISTLFNFGTPETNISFSPVHHWKLNDINTGLNDVGSLASNNAVRGAVTGSGPTTGSTSVAAVPSWKIPSALTIPSINYTTALDFNGSSDYIDFGNDSSLNISTSSYSISFWIKTNDPGTAVLSQKANNELAVFIASSKIQWNGPNTFFSTSTITGDVWKHICLVTNSSNSYIYINGVQDATVSSSQINSSTTSDNFRIGGRSAQFNYDGQFSNYALYNTDLSASQVSTLYNSGQPEAAISLSPVGWWKLDSTTITDYGSGGNNGTNNGTTQVTSDVYTGNIPVNGVSTTLPSTALQQSDLQFDSPYSNYSLKFDVVSYVDTNFAIPNWTKYAYSIWFKFNGSTIAGYDHLIGNVSGGGNTTGRAIIGFRGTNLYLNMGDETNYWYDESQSAAPLLDGTWHNIVLNVYETGQDIYVDGSLLRTYTYTGSVTTGVAATSNNFINKSGTNASSNGVDCNVDEHAVFSRLLTTAEILSIYNNGKPDDISSLSPNYWWRLGENVYFNDVPAFTVPNSIAGAPNGIGSGDVTSMLSADAPGTYANGVGTNLDIVDRVGDAALSVANSQSYNMIPSDISPYVPEYVGDQISNAFEMTFDGVDDYITVSQINLGTTNTISLWYNGEVINYCALLGNDDAPNDYAVWVNNGTTVSYKVQDASNGVVDWNVTNVNDGNWHHFAFSRTNTTINFYIDGNLQTVNSNNLANNDTKIDTIGAKTNGSYPFKGKLDEVAIFDKALTADQVKFDLYEPTATGTNQTADIANNPNLPTPVAWYRMVD